MIELLYAATFLIIGYKVLQKFQDISHSSEKLYIKIEDQKPIPKFKKKL